MLVFLLLLPEVVVAEFPVLRRGAAPRGSGKGGGVVKLTGRRLLTAGPVNRMRGVRTTFLTVLCSWGARGDVHLLPYLLPFPQAVISGASASETRWEQRKDERGWWLMVG